jgi:hypothetical protein
MADDNSKMGKLLALIESLKGFIGAILCIVATIALAVMPNVDVTIKTTIGGALTACALQYFTSHRNSALNDQLMELVKNSQAAYLSTQGQAIVSEFKAGKLPSASEILNLEPIVAPIVEEAKVVVPALVEVAKQDIPPMANPTPDVPAPATPYPGEVKVVTQITPQLPFVTNPAVPQ